MPYVNWTGDWSRLQPAVLTNARIYVFPIRVPIGPLKAICDQRVAGPSGGQCTAEPIPIPIPGNQNETLLIFAFADFPDITSQDANESNMGFLSERDVGIFFPVEVKLEGDSQGVFVMNPFLWVDNPAGVIIGRETFGFPKIMSEIGWKPGKLEFDVKTLVFPTFDPTTQAVEKRILHMKRDTWLPFFSFFESIVEEVVELADDLGVDDVLEQAMQFVYDFIEQGLTATGFHQIRIPLLKQFRNCVNGVDTAFQKVVWAEFEITDIDGMFFYPEIFSEHKLKLFDFPSTPVAAALGLGAGDVDLGVGIRIDCDLVLRGHHF